jgi:hypothetical protein
MEDRRVKFHTNGQKSFGKTNWVKAKTSPPKIDDENPELVGKAKFVKPVAFPKKR